VSILFWHLLLFQLLWDEIQLTRAPPFFHVLRPSMRLQDRKLDSGVQCSLIGPPSIDHFLFGQVLLNTMACFHLQLVNDVNVYWQYECINFLKSFCNNWIVAPLYCVVGPCPMALEWHRRMSGYALEGLGDYRRLDTLLASSCVILLSLFIRTVVVTHIEMFIFVATSEAFLPLLFRKVHICRETSCLALWLEMCHILSILVKIL